MKFFLFIYLFNYFLTLLVYELIFLLSVDSCNGNRVTLLPSVGCDQDELTANLFPVFKKIVLGCFVLSWLIKKTKKQNNAKTFLFIKHAVLSAM